LPPFQGGAKHSFRIGKAVVALVELRQIGSYRRTSGIAIMHVAQRGAVELLGFSVTPFARQLDRLVVPSGSLKHRIPW
jgi:hypothetical protein